MHRGPVPLNPLVSHAVLRGYGVDGISWAWWGGYGELKDYEAVSAAAALEVATRPHVAIKMPVPPKESLYDVMDRWDPDTPDLDVKYMVARMLGCRSRSDLRLAWEDL